MGRFILVAALVLGLVQLSLANHSGNTRQRNVGRTLGRNNVGRMDSLPAVDSYSTPSLDLPISEPEMPLTDSYSAPAPAPLPVAPQRDLPIAPARKSFSGFSSKSFQKDLPLPVPEPLPIETPVSSGYSAPARKTISKDLPRPRPIQREQVVTPAPIVDKCLPRNPCRNGGLCISDRTLFRGFRCQCSDYFFGDLCERDLEPPSCKENSCGESGLCDVVDHPEHGFPVISCTCRNGDQFYEEIDCGPLPLKVVTLPTTTTTTTTTEATKLIENPCDSYSCLNGGTCVSTLRGYDLVVECTCAEGYAGSQCENEIVKKVAKVESDDVCSRKLNPCLNGGRCTHMNSNYGSFVHCECLSGFSGQHCERSDLAMELVSPCESSPCKNNGHCKVIDQHNFYCVCQRPFFGTLCEEVRTTTTTTRRTTTTTTTTTTEATPVDHCSSNPCNYNGECSNIIYGDYATFWCDCYEPFYGRTCEYEEETTTTTTTTTTTAAPFRRINLTTKAVVYNPCDQPGICMNNGYCVPNGYAFRCYCTDGFEGLRCETKTLNPCDRLVCMNAGKCIALTSTDAICDCLPGYSGQLCEKQPTTTTPAYSTFEESGEFGGYSGEEELSFEEFKQPENPCLNEGKLDSNGRCKCPWGWTGPNCEICLTECASNPCSPNKKCIAKYGGGYECRCPADRAGQNCEIQNDACSKNPCLNSGSCKPKVGGLFECQCNTPWSGRHCEERWNNPCTEDVLRSLDVINFEFPWESSKYIVCTDIDQWIAMNCSDGTLFNKEIKQCVPETFELPELPAEMCLNDGQVMLTEDGELECHCRVGFTGVNCESELDECYQFAGKRLSGRCVDQVGTYYFECPDGRIGLDCMHSIEMPCTEENIAASLEYFAIGDEFHYVHCDAVDIFTVRKCAGGLFWNQEEQTCTLDKPDVKTGVCSTYPCQNAGKCLTLGASSFKCQCKEGFTGLYCEERIDLCKLKNPCMNGGKCLSYPGGYTCVCPDKLIDDCCCNGVVNPCPLKPIPGVNTYFPHLFPHRYIHCDFEGRAFVRTCAPGTRWRQAVLSCLPDDFVLNTTEPTIGSTLPQRELTILPVKKVSGGGYSQEIFEEPTTTTPRPVITPAREQIIRKPFVPQTAYSAPAPVISREQPLPVRQPAPVIAREQPLPVRQPVVQPTYSAPAPVIAREQPLPVRQPVVQPTYSAELPVEEEFISGEQFLDQEEEFEEEEGPVGYAAPAPTTTTTTTTTVAPFKFAKGLIPESSDSYSSGGISGRTLPRPVQRGRVAMPEPVQPVQPVQRGRVAMPEPVQPVQPVQRGRVAMPEPIQPVQPVMETRARLVTPASVQRVRSGLAPAPVQRGRTTIQSTESSFGEETEFPVFEETSARSVVTPATVQRVRSGMVQRGRLSVPEPVLVDEPVVAPVRVRQQPAPLQRGRSSLPMPVEEPVAVVQTPVRSRTVGRTLGGQQQWN